MSKGRAEARWRSLSIWRSPLARSRGRPGTPSLTRRTTGTTGTKAWRSASACFACLALSLEIPRGEIGYAPEEQDKIVEGSMT